MVAIFKDKKNFFYAISILDRPFKIKFYKVLQSGHEDGWYTTFELT